MANLQRSRMQHMSLQIYTAKWCYGICSISAHSGRVTQRK